MQESTIVSEGFKGGTRGAPIMPRDAVSRTANVGTVGTNGHICNSITNPIRVIIQGIKSDDIRFYEVI